MHAVCTQYWLTAQPHGRRLVEADFDAGTLRADAGARTRPAGGSNQDEASGGRRAHGLSHESGLPSPL